MAHLFPQQLGETFTAHTVSAEQAVYTAVGKLDGNFWVFHDLRWDEPALHDSRTIGQADFIIAHPDYGFVALEVKGGRCDYSADDRLWFSTDRFGNRHRIHDPFEQAADCARVVRKLLKMTVPGINRLTFAQSAALFPDCSMIKQPLRADIQPWRILDQSDLLRFDQVVRQLFEEGFAGRRIDRSDGMKIIDGLRKLWGIHDAAGRRRLDLRLRQSYQRLIDLTERQLSVLRSLREAPQVLVRGCAGSGKTTLAVHKAKMLADAGKRVGLFCFNIPLGEYLQKQCEAFSNITAGPIAELFTEWLTDAGHAPVYDDPQEWYDTTLPNLLVDHLDRVPHRFDAVIVDEGQDIRASYWTALELMLADPGNAIFYIFADQGQNIYHGRMNLSFTAVPYLLNRNVRNTNQVFTAIRACCEIDSDIEPSGVDGPRPELYRYGDDAEMLTTLENVLGKLCSDGITPNDIAILGTRSQERTSLREGSRIGPFTLTSQSRSRTDIWSMTTHRFKGMEAPVVILCELDDEPYRIDDLIYVGMTRTTGHLVALATGETHSRLKESGAWVLP